MKNTTIASGEEAADDGRRSDTQSVTSQDEHSHHGKKKTHSAGKGTWTGAAAAVDELSHDRSHSASIGNEEGSESNNGEESSSSNSNYCDKKKYSESSNAAAATTLSQAVATVKSKDDLDFALPEDTYTLVYIFGWNTKPFLLGLLIFLLQITILVLITYDLLEDNGDAIGSDGRKLNQPVLLERHVAGCQVLALLLVVAYLDDFHLALVALITVSLFPTLQMVETESTPEDDKDLTRGCFWNAITCKWKNIRDQWTGGSTYQERENEEQAEQGLNASSSQPKQQGCAYLCHASWQEFPNANPISWWFSNLLRMFQGLFILSSSFILLVQADTMLEIFLNFAALAFVSELDNIAFKFATQGFFGEDIKHDTEIIERGLGAKKHDRKGCERVFFEFIRPVVAGLLAFGLIFSWSYIYGRQKDLYYLRKQACHRIRVRFGSEVYPLQIGGRVDLSQQLRDTPRLVAPSLNETDPPDLHFAYFSGEYVADFAENTFIASRPVYFERGTRDAAAGVFYYCAKVGSWVFTIPAFAYADNPTGEDEDAYAVMPKQLVEQCSENKLGFGDTGLGWLMCSPPTEALTLEMVPTDGWVAWTGELESVSSLSFQCNSCTSDVSCGVYRGKCEDYKDDHGDHGKKCNCATGYEGYLCNTPKPCESLLLFDEHDDTVGPYYIVSDARFYNRPAYIREIAEGEATSCYYKNCSFEVVLYTGLRWYDIYFSQEEGDLYGINFTDTLTFDGDANEFHSYWGDILLANTVWYSESTTQYNPTGTLRWYKVGSTRTAGNYGPFGYTFTIDQRFECLQVDCGVKNVCGREGICANEVELSVNDEKVFWNNATSIIGGKCNCTDLADGHFCENRITTTSGEL
jgi:hypothetical protein